MAFKNKEKEKEYYKYWEKYKRSEESKIRKKETTRLWIIQQREERNKKELQNGKDLGYEGVKIRDDIRKRIEAGTTKILINEDKSIICFHKNEDGHWVNNTGKKKYLHREVIKRGLGLTDEDLTGFNRLENLEILTQSEHMDRHKDKYIKNLSKGRGK